MIRCFVALDLPEAVRIELASLVTTLQKTGADVKWIRAENLHLTLKFLGHLPEGRLSQVRQTLKTTARRQKSFRVHFSGVGVFPTLEHPSVLWVGIDEGEDSLKTLAETVEADLAAIGFSREKRSFSGHATLGRVRSPCNQKDLIQAIKGTSFSSAHRIEINHLTLYKSTLTPQGSHYEVIEQFAIV